MDWPASAGDYRPRLDAVRAALYSLLDQLTPDDRITLISFNAQARVDVPLVTGAQRARLEPAIAALKPQGGTNIMAGLRLGYQQLVGKEAPDRARRILLLTDAQPNVGPSGAADFFAKLQEYAAANVGFTLLGVGYDFGDAFAREISQVRGANGFYLADDARIATVFSQDFDFLVTPAAYDLTLDVGVPDGVGIRAVYGVPDYLPGRTGARITVPTLFLSRRGGGAAIVMRLTFSTTPDFAQPVALGGLALAYTLPDGTRESSELALALPAGLSPTGEPAHFADPAARRGALLLDTALVLREAAWLGWGRRLDAAQMIKDFLECFDEMSLGLSDRTDPSSRGLSQERRLLEQLLTNLGGYYGWGGYYEGYYP
jgi:Ca-activated chloride channel family protein